MNPRRLFCDVSVIETWSGNSATSKARIIIDVGTTFPCAKHKQKNKTNTSVIPLVTAGDGSTGKFRYVCSGSKAPHTA